MLLLEVVLPGDLGDVEIVIGEELGRQLLAQSAGVGVVEDHLGLRVLAGQLDVLAQRRQARGEIGRASCRERREEGEVGETRISYRGRVVVGIARSTTSYCDTTI